MNDYTEKPFFITFFFNIFELRSIFFFFDLKVKAC